MQSDRSIASTYRLGVQPIGTPAWLSRLEDRHHNPATQRSNSQDVGMSFTLVYDGGCPFCRHFARRSELLGGLPDLIIRDGRSDHELRRMLRHQGFNLSNGAVLMEGERIWHGSEAIAVLCQHLMPSDPLLQLLHGLFRNPRRANLLYPGLLAARQLALELRGLPLDPDQA